MSELREPRKNLLSHMRVKQDEARECDPFLEKNYKSLTNFGREKKALGQKFLSSDSLAS